MSTHFRAENDMASLPCGKLYDGLIEHVADRTEPDEDTRAHQQTCPYCRAALSELADIWAPVHELAEVDVTAPDTLTVTVMERVVAIAANAWHAVVLQNPGVNRIAAWVVAIIARRAAASVSGVAAVRGSVTPPSNPDDAMTMALRKPAPNLSQRLTAAGVGVAGRRVVINLEVTGDGVRPLPILSQDIRSTVIRHVGALTGLEVVEVNVSVIEIEPARDEDA